MADAVATDGHSGIPRNAGTVLRCLQHVAAQCIDIRAERANQIGQDCELVAWPTQSPQTATPAFRAMRGQFYVASSTWRHNASIFEPSGRIAAQIRPPESVLTYEIDLSYAILPWSAKLENGKALQKKFGEGVAFHYYEDEDRGIFWSND